MDTRGVAAILLKVTGLVLVSYSLTQLPAYFPVKLQGSDWSLPMSFAAAVITLGPTIILGICFWLFPGTIANKIVSGGLEQASPFDIREIQLIALTTLGLYLIAHGLADLIYNVATAIQLRRINPDTLLIPASIVGAITGAAVEIGLGAILCLGRRGMMKIIERMRG